MTPGLTGGANAGLALPQAAVLVSRGQSPNAAADGTTRVVAGLGAVGCIVRAINLVSGGVRFPAVSIASRDAGLPWCVSCRSLPSFFLPPDSLCTFGFAHTLVAA